MVDHNTKDRLMPLVNSRVVLFLASGAQTLAITGVAPERCQ